MGEYRKYISALRKCAIEHENDRTFTGQIITSDLCRDTAKLLEELEQEPVLDKIRAEIAECGSIMVAYAITKDTKTDKGIEKLVSGVLKQAKEQVLEIIDKYRSDKESFKPMVEIDLHSVIKQKYIEREVLDKIRAEIEEAQTHDGIYIDRAYVLEIIDKYTSDH